MLNQELLESQLMELPLYGYFFLKTEQLMFSHRVRHICKQECPMYNKTWACPPAVGSVESCQARCMAYPDFLMIATVTEVQDIANIPEALATRGDHEELTRQVRDMVREQGLETCVLSSEACALCESCAWPDGPCRHPEYMNPCIESHGIILTEVAEECGLPFQYGDNVVTWFSLIFYREPEEQP